MTTRIRKPTICSLDKFLMVNDEAVDFYIVDTMIELIKMDRFVLAVKLARGNAPRLSLREAKDLADAIRDQINGRIQNYTLQDNLNLLNL